MDQPIWKAQVSGDVGNGGALWQPQCQRGIGVQAGMIMAQQPVKADLDVQLLLPSTGRSPL